MERVEQEEKDKLAGAVVEQDNRMDRIEARANLSRGTYSQIVDAAKKVQENSDKLRNDVDELLNRVDALEQYVADDPTNGTEGDTAG